MKYVLENDKISIEIDSFGAELKSVIDKKTNREYMWYADKKYWGRTSPVLFPFVGSLKNKEFIVDGRQYPMGQHGFARDMEHSLLSKDDKSIWFILESNEETLAKYPFEFKLRIGYEIKDNSVKVLWEVENPADNNLPFSIGAHPAFICPRYNEEDKSGYKLSFAKFAKESLNTAKDIRVNADAELKNIEKIYHHGNTRDTGLAITENLILDLQEGKCDITPGFFDRCTYMIEGNQANSVGIVDPDGEEFVRVLFDTPLFAIWSPEEKNAPFLCIEPWYGRADHVDFEGDIYKREFTNMLEGQDVFHSEYVMIFS